MNRLTILQKPEMLPSRPQGGVLKGAKGEA